MKNKLFQMVCFLAIMDGFMSKSPKYIEVKMLMLDEAEPQWAFQRLHPSLQKEVLLWCRKWDYPVPNEVIDYILAFEDYHPAREVVESIKDDE